MEKSNDDTNAFIEKLWAVRRVGEIIDELDLKGKNDELVKELVELATRHGVLTPYTSFLADEQTDRHNPLANFHRAEANLRDLSVADGQYGFAQRQLKGEMQRAAREPSYGADAAAIQNVEAAKGGGVGGVSAARSPSANGIGHRGRQLRIAPRSGVASEPTADMASREADEAAGDKGPVQRVRNIGRKTFFLQGKGWVDSVLTPEQQKQATNVTRYSDDYFKLVEKHGPDLAKYLATDEPVMLELDGQVYSF